MSNKNHIVFKQSTSFLKASIDQNSIVDFCHQSYDNQVAFTKILNELIENHRNCGGFCEKDRWTFK